MLPSLSAQLERDCALQPAAFWQSSYTHTLSQMLSCCCRAAVVLLQVPKSIDNDVMLVDKTFGFDTVVQEVVTRPLLAAKVGVHWGHSLVCS